jgi:hypothetical protein
MGSGDMELADGVLTRNHAYCGPQNERGRPPKAAVFKTDSYLVINERVAFMSSDAWCVVLAIAAVSDNMIHQNKQVSARGTDLEFWLCRPLGR